MKKGNGRIILTKQEDNETLLFDGEGNLTTPPSPSPKLNLITAPISNVSDYKIFKVTNGNKYGKEDIDFIFPNNIVEKFDVWNLSIIADISSITVKSVEQTLNINVNISGGNVNDLSDFNCFFIQELPEWLTCETFIGNKGVLKLKFTQNIGTTSRNFKLKLFHINAASSTIYERGYFEIDITQVTYWDDVNSLIVTPGSIQKINPYGFNSELLVDITGLNKNWRITSKPSFVTCEPMNGNDNEIVKLSFDKNLSNNERSGNIIVRHEGDTSIQRTVNTLQMGLYYSLTIDGNTNYVGVPRSGFKTNITINTFGGSGRWIANVPAGVVLSKNQGNNGDLVTITLPFNTHMEIKSFEIKFYHENDNTKTESVYITQNRKADPYLNVDLVKYDFKIEGGTKTFNIYSNINWNATINNDKYKLNGTSSVSGNGDQPIKIICNANSGNAIISISSELGVLNIELTQKIIISETKLELSASKYTISSGGGTITYSYALKKYEDGVLISTKTDFTPAFTITNEAYFKLDTGSKTITVSKNDTSNEQYCEFRATYQDIESNIVALTMREYVAMIKCNINDKNRLYDKLKIAGGTLFDFKRMIDNGSNYENVTIIDHDTVMIDKLVTIKIFDLNDQSNKDGVYYIENVKLVPKEPDEGKPKPTHVAITILHTAKMIYENGVFRDAEDMEQQMRVKANQQEPGERVYFRLQSHVTPEFELTFDFDPYIAL